MNRFAVCLLLAVPALVSTAATPGTAPNATTTNGCSNITLGDLGALNGFVPSPNDAWHQDITNAPIDPKSQRIITVPGNLANRYLHPDFSSVVGGNAGIPYTVIDSSTVPSVPVTLNNLPDTENDQTVFPIPSNVLIEATPGQCWTDNGDHHAIVLDRNKCVLYEFYDVNQCNGKWTTYSSTIWDMTKTEQRPYGYTSADAAGLSVFEGLIRYDEIVAGSINHAIRFTASHTKQDANNGYFTAPATHASGTLWGTDNVIGMRMRLKADFDISGFSQSNQVILRAMKQYGMILADNGSDFFFQGTPDPRWNDNDLNALKYVPSTAFDVVQMNPIYDANNYPAGQAPVISSFTPSSSTITAGSSVTLTPTVTGDSYDYIDSVGFIRGPVTVTPAATTTYMLTSRNAFGSTSASTTVTVNAAPAIPVAPPVSPVSITIARSAPPFNFTFKAIAKMSDGSIKDITSTVVWHSSNPAIATIVNGQLTVLNSGTVTITAQSGTVTSAGMKVTVTLNVSH